MVLGSILLTEYNMQLIFFEPRVACLVIVGSVLSYNVVFDTVIRCGLLDHMELELDKTSQIFSDLLRWDH